MRARYSRRRDRQLEHHYFRGSTHMEYEDTVRGQENRVGCILAQAEMDEDIINVVLHQSPWIRRLLLNDVEPEELKIQRQALGVAQLADF